MAFVLRRCFFSLLLTVGLLMSQQAALLHELGHSLSHTTRNATSSAKSAEPNGGASHSEHQASELCHTCLAFAQLAFSLAPHEFTLHLTQLPLQDWLTARVLAVDTQALRVCNRGPPAFL